MIGLRQVKARIDDLKSWQTKNLERRLKLASDMWTALLGVGCEEGLHRNLLSLDIIIISRILTSRYALKL